jgi:hypothetical protein
MAVLAKVKGKVYASEEHRIKYEDLYREAWLEQNKNDVKMKPELKFRQVFKGKKFGYQRPLSRNAVMINNLLKEDKSPKHIAKTMDENLQFIENIIDKYDLPRD